MRIISTSLEDSRQQKKSFVLQFSVAIVAMAATAGIRTCEVHLPASLLRHFTTIAFKLQLHRTPLKANHVGAVTSKAAGEVQINFKLT